MRTGSGLRIFLQGNLRQLSSFSLINRQLVAGLRRRGHRVTAFASDDGAPLRINPAAPDVYVSHAYPFEARSAPGRVNVFVLIYEYPEPDAELRALVARLNAAFDLVIVPAPFVRPVLAAAGLRIPVAVVPWGYDPAHFHPRVRPAARPKAKLVFTYVGAVNPRKGTDLLLDAYRAEFGAGDDVALVIRETFRHHTWDRFRIALHDRYVGRGRRRSPPGDGPPIVWIEGVSASIAGYYTGADVGVFPHRGEAFGLPVLECIASGRRVIVTAGSGPDAFCSAANAWRIEARSLRRGGRTRLEPDPAHLRRLLRAAYTRGPASASQHHTVARTVRGWTWAHAVDALDATIRRAHASAARRDTVTARRTVARRTTTPARQRSAGEPSIAYFFSKRGMSSWMRLCAGFDDALRSSFADYRAFAFRTPSEPGARVPAHPISGPPAHRLTGAPAHLSRPDIVLGQSEYALEGFLKVRRHNPDAIVIVHQECTVLGDHVAIVNRERALCGLAPIATRPLDFWRNRLENALADHFIVSSSVARGFYLANGFDRRHIHVIPQGMHAGRRHFRGLGARTRFLFLGTDPFRKGVRPLLAAWDRAGLRDAELVCFTPPEVLQSELLLKYLVRNPNITMLPMRGRRAFFPYYAQTDCHVLPSLEDAFSQAVADGMGVGKPAIVSSMTGIQDLIVHGENGHVVPAGDIEALAESLRCFAERRRLRAMGEAAYETARAYPWKRFRRSVVEVVRSIWAARR